MHDHENISNEHLKPVPGFGLDLNPVLMQRHSGLLLQGWLGVNVGDFRLANNVLNKSYNPSASVS